MYLKHSLLSTLLLTPFVLALSPSDIPSDTPISTLVESAKASRAKGDFQDAVLYFDAAISRDATDYLTIFQRGATYLSLGRNAQAVRDFDKVLTLKPDFSGALLQRAKIKAKNADWTAAREDYIKGGKTSESLELTELSDAEEAASAAERAEKKGDLEGCITHAGNAILVAGTALHLRQLRSRCRFARGDTIEGLSDLQHILQITPGSTDPHLQISAGMFYAMSELEKGTSQVRKCLQSDPDSKKCKALLRREKRLEKVFKKMVAFREKRQYNSAVKLVVGEGDEEGLLKMAKEDFAELTKEGVIHEKGTNLLYVNLVEMACDFYGQMNNRKRAAPFCKEALELKDTSLPALLHKAQQQIDDEQFEAALSTLNTAKEHHPQESQIGTLTQKAQTLLKRSKIKDYYKVLDVPRDADDRQIKKAYRQMTKKHHPDKALSQGVSKEDAERKMAQINEAWEVLGDPEKKAQFDSGVDPNDPQAGSPFQGGSPFGGGGQPIFFQSSGGGRTQFQFSGGGFPGGGFPGGFQFGGM